MNVNFTIPTVVGQALSVLVVQAGALALAFGVLTQPQEQLAVAAAGSIVTILLGMFHVQSANRASNERIALIHANANRPDPVPSILTPPSS